jgi:general secretion pathway protein N
VRRSGSSGTFLRWGLLLAGGLVAVVAVLVAFAPASILDAALASGSAGRFRLADAEGTVWRGSGRFVIADDLPAAGDPGATPTGGVWVVDGFALPARIAWRVSALPLLLGLVDASVSLDGMPQPVRLSGSVSDLRISAGTLDLPSAQLARLGSPWNTIQPSAAVALRWEALTLRNGVVDGRASIELRDTSSAMTPVRPLGTYRIDVNGTGRDVALTLSTLSGPLQLQGSGTWSPRSGIRFTAEARAEGIERARLQSLLGLIGRRDGEKTIIRIGA